MKPINYLILVLGLSSFSAFSQTSHQLILQNKKGKTIYQLKEGDRVRIVAIENYIGSPNYIGALKIINDSLIAVNGHSLPIDSIYKMGRLKKKSQIIGHSIAVFGSGVIGIGIGMFINSEKATNPLEGLFGFIGGSVSIVVGTAAIIAGENSANGDTRRVKQDFKIKVLKT